jgi:hypothetical protein
MLRNVLVAIEDDVSNQLDVAASRQIIDDALKRHEREGLIVALAYSNSEIEPTSGPRAARNSQECWSCEATTARIYLTCAGHL